MGSPLSRQGNVNNKATRGLTKGGKGKGEGGKGRGRVNGVGAVQGKAAQGVGQAGGGIQAR